MPTWLTTPPPSGVASFLIGNFAFTSGFALQTIEVLPDGTKAYVVKMNMPGFQYRSYIHDTLYGDLANLFDPGFEDPIQGTGSAWSFRGPAGVAGNGSVLTSGNPAAPQGSHVAFLQQNGAISQVVNFPAAGSYTIGVSAAQRGNSGTSNQTVEVRVDGVMVGTFAPAGTGYATYTTGSFRVSAGSHTITFIGVNPTGADFTALLDEVRIDNVSPIEPTVPGFVNLSSAFNRMGIVADGTAFGGGLDGGGTALSSSLVGTSLATLCRLRSRPRRRPRRRQRRRAGYHPARGQKRRAELAGDRRQGRQPYQTFLVTYTDGTTAGFTRSVSAGLPETARRRVHGEYSLPQYRLRWGRDAGAFPRLPVHLRAEPHQGGPQPHPARERQPSRSSPPRSSPPRAGTCHRGRPPPSSRGVRRS